MFRWCISYVPLVDWHCGAFWIFVVFKRLLMIVISICFPLPSCMIKIKVSENCSQLAFVEKNSFRIVSGNSGNSPETMRKLFLSTKFPHQEIRWIYDISRRRLQIFSSWILKMNLKRKIVIAIRFQEQKHFLQRHFILSN